MLQIEFLGLFGISFQIYMFPPTFAHSSFLPVYFLDDQQFIVRFLYDAVNRISESSLLEYHKDTFFFRIIICFTGRNLSHRAPHSCINTDVFSLLLEAGISDSWTDNFWLLSTVCFQLIFMPFSYPHSPFSNFIPISESLHTFPSTKFASAVFGANCYVKLRPQSWVKYVKKVSFLTQW